MLLQISAVGVPGTQESTPPVQTPAFTQAPPPHVVAKESTVPSQSSSMLLQTSALGAPGVQESTPAVHVPAAAQAPTPQVVGKPSTVPSQSLSMLSQISGPVGVQPPAPRQMMLDWTEKPTSPHLPRRQFAVEVVDVSAFFPKSVCSL